MPSPTRFYDGDIKVAQVAGPLVPEYPFDGDLSTAIYRQTYWIDRDYYKPLPLNMPNPAMTDAYLVNESKIEHIGGGILSFERVWANIPKTRTESEKYAWNSPGFTSTGAMYSYGATAATRGGGYDNLIVEGTYYVGQQVTITQLPYNSQVNSQWIDNKIYTTVRTVHSTISGGIIVAALPVAPVTTLDHWNYPRTSVTTASSSRPERSIICNSKVTYDYFLPGVSPGINSVDDISINQRTLFYSNNGGETNSLNDLGNVPTGTVPSIEEYRSWMTQGRLIIPESSGVQRWMGNIYERRTRYITAE